MLTDIIVMSRCVSFQCHCAYFIISLFIIVQLAIAVNLSLCVISSCYFPIDRQLTESLDVEEVVRVTYQVMINHPLNPNLLQVNDIENESLVN